MYSESSRLPQARRARALRRLSYVTPENGEKVFGHDRYWTLAFLQVFLDACRYRCLDVPEEILPLARLAPELAALVRVGDDSEDFPSERDRRSWRVFAAAVHGEVARAAGRRAEADRAFRRAYALCGEGPVLAVAAADLALRQAALQAEEGSSEAPPTLERALELFRHPVVGRQAGSREGLAEALLLRAAFRASVGEAGMIDAAEAAYRAGPGKGRPGRVLAVAVHRVFQETGARHVQAEHHQTALALLHRIRRRHFSHAVRSMPKMRLFWTEGRVLSTLGITRMAVRRLEAACQGFERLGAGWEVAAVNFDLAISLVMEGSEAEAVELLGRARSRLEARGAPPDQLEALARAHPEVSALRAERDHLIARNDSPAVPRALWTGLVRPPAMAGAGRGKPPDVRWSPPLRTAR
ncbi:MAG: hypothetical protein MI919_07610 [Holophagales bacterium]|nr:hypothetical protein [Holophagales bacterium]